jgi:3-hydroxymyristoyl/3-hydroxydecanoyl-(acyl carrier protein) dehydratase
MKIDILTKKQIEKYLQISDPFLMIDIGRDIIPGKSANSIKYLDNDWFFECHLKKENVMPGTLQIEAMLQTLILALYTLDIHADKLAFVTEIKTNLYSKVTKESQLCIFSELKTFNRGIAFGVAYGMCGEKIVCKGEFKLISPHLIPQLGFIKK